MIALIHWTMDTTHPTTGEPINAYFAMEPELFTSGPYYTHEQDEYGNYIGHSFYAFMFDNSVDKNLLTPIPKAFVYKDHYEATYIQHVDDDGNRWYELVTALIPDFTNNFFGGDRLVEFGVALENDYGAIILP